METKNKRSSYACMFHGLCIYFCSLNLLLFDVTRARRVRGRRWQRRQSAAAVSCWRLRRRLRLIKRGQRPCFIPCQIPRQDEIERGGEMFQGIASTYINIVMFHNRSKNTTLSVCRGKTLEKHRRAAQESQQKGNKIKDRVGLTCGAGLVIGLPCCCCAQLPGPPGPPGPP